MYSILNSEGKELLFLKNYDIKPLNGVPNAHTHNFLEISVVKEGKGEYYVDNKVYDVLPGDVFLFNNIEHHGLNVTGSNNMTNMVIHFEPNFIWAISGNSSFDFRYLSIFFNRAQDFQNRLERNSDTTRQVTQLLLDIEKEFVMKNPEYELMIKSMMLRVLVLILRGCAAEIERDENYMGAYYNLPSVDKIINYVDSHIAEEIKLEDLSEIVHMNSAYLSYFFKKNYGKNIFEYITIKRIERSKEYLLSTDKSVIEIANICGFNSAAGFNKAFKKLAGFTPSDFRKIRPKY
jgi:AraC-like DNA-binding protein